MDGRKRWQWREPWQSNQRCRWLADVGNGVHCRLLLLLLFLTHGIDGDGGLEHLGVPGGRRRRQRGGDGEEGEDDDDDALGRRHLHEEALVVFVCVLVDVRYCWTTTGLFI